LSAFTKVTSSSYQDSIGHAATALSSQPGNGFLSGFAQSIVLPNVQIFAYLLGVGEIFAGLSLLATGFIIIFLNNQDRLVKILLISGLVIGSAASLTSFISTGWMANPYESAAASDLLLTALQIILLTSYIYLYLSKRPARAPVKSG
jgi:hypothetical protein